MRLEGRDCGVAFATTVACTTSNVEAPAACTDHDSVVDLDPATGAEEPGVG
jgi:hypothetical protein